MAFKNELLIETIGRYRCLYDPWDKYYYDIAQKDIAWEKISSTVKCNAVECKRKWNLLRDSYRKAVKKRLKDRENQIHKPWRYEEHMSFLLPFLGERESRSSLSQATYDNEATASPENSQPATEGEKHERPNMMPDADNDSSSQEQMILQYPCSSRESSPSRHSKIHPRSSSSVSRILKNYFDQRSKLRENSDHLKKFFEAVEATVRTFDPRLQIEIKAKISNLVSEYELKNFYAKNSPVESQQSALGVHSTLKFETQVPDDAQPTQTDVGELL